MSLDHVVAASERISDLEQQRDDALKERDIAQASERIMRGNAEVLIEDYRSIRMQFSIVVHERDRIARELEGALRELSRLRDERDSRLLCLEVE